MRILCLASALVMLSGAMMPSEASPTDRLQIENTTNQTLFLHILYSDSESISKILPGKIHPNSKIDIPQSNFSGLKNFNIQFSYKFSDTKSACTFTLDGFYFQGHHKYDFDAMNSDYRISCDITSRQDVPHTPGLVTQTTILTVSQNG